MALKFLMKNTNAIKIFALGVALLLGASDLETVKAQSQTLKQKGGGLRTSSNGETFNSVQTASDREAKLIDELRELLAPVGVQVESRLLIERDYRNRQANLRPTQQLRLSWLPLTIDDARLKTEKLAVDSPSTELKGQLVLVERRTEELTRLPRLRSVELSTSQLFIAATDSEGRLRYWTLVSDPRIVRAERPDATGLLSGEVLYDAQAELHVSLPDDKQISQVRIYKPEWNGGAFALQSIGIVAFK